MSRKGIGICLSGGGYRATLFHAGALRRLNELGVLSHPGLQTITSVSGGSITSAFLATAFDWPLTEPVEEEEWKRSFESRVRAMTKRNIRTGSFLRSFLPGRSTVGEIAKRYDESLDTPLTLAELPSEFVICATDMAFGANWEFGGGRMGSYRTGSTAIPVDWTIGKAVAASSCFPPVFQPMPIRRAIGVWEGEYLVRDDEWRKGMADLRLSDGGVYDNMGLEPLWSSEADDPGQYEFVLVSDAGGLFSAAPDEGLPSRVKRYQAIQENQARALRRRWLVERYRAGKVGGAYWGIGGATTDYAPQERSGYPEPLAKDAIARIRTDLDAFSEAEAAILQNHGYFLADVSLRTYARALLSGPAPPAVAPFPGWGPASVEESDVRAALADSHKRKKLGRR